MIEKPRFWKLGSEMCMDFWTLGGRVRRAPDDFPTVWKRWVQNAVLVGDL